MRYLIHSFIPFYFPFARVLFFLHLEQSPGWLAGWLHSSASLAAQRASLASWLSPLVGRQLAASAELLAARLLLMLIGMLDDDALERLAAKAIEHFRCLATRSGLKTKSARARELLRSSCCHSFTSTPTSAMRLCIAEQLIQAQLDLADRLAG